LYKILQKENLKIFYIPGLVVGLFLSPSFSIFLVFSVTPVVSVAAPVPAVVEPVSPLEPAAPSLVLVVVIAAAKIEDHDGNRIKEVRDTSRT
jgi:hypothetical protein